MSWPLLPRRGLVVLSSVPAEALSKGIGQTGEKGEKNRHRERNWRKSKDSRLSRDCICTVPQAEEGRVCTNRKSFATAFSHIVRQGFESVDIDHQIHDVGLAKDGSEI